MQRLTTFLINLDRDEDRLAYMHKHLQQYGISYERLPAVMGDAIPAGLQKYFEKPDAADVGGLRAGEIGCYASHLLIHQRIVEEGITNPVLVLEDDLEFTAGLQEFLDNLSLLPEDWEIVRLSNPAKSPAATVFRLSRNLNAVRYWRVPNNTGAYLINRKGAAKFLHYSEKRFRAVDEDLRRPWEHGVVTYGVLPPPFRANIFDSSIDALSGTRRLPGRKRFPKARFEAWRALKYKLKNFGLPGSARMLLASTIASMKR